MDLQCWDIHGETPLHYAALNGWTDVCRLLVEKYKVNSHCKNGEGWRAIYCACIHDSYLDIVKYLVSVYRDLPAQDNCGRTPLSISEGETKAFFEGIIG